MVSPASGSLINGAKVIDMVADIEALILESNDVVETLRLLTRRLVPTLGDWASISYFSRDRTEYYVVVSPADPAKRYLAQQLEESVVQVLPPDVQMRVHSGEPVLIDDMTAMVESKLVDDATTQAIYNTIEARSTLLVPLPLYGEHPGLFILSMAESGRTYSRADQEAIEHLTKSIGPALEGLLLRSKVEQAQSLRARSDSQLQMALAVAQMGVFRCNNSLTAIDWSDATASLLGLNSNVEPSFEAMRSAVHFEDRERLAALLNKCALSNDVFEIEFRVVHPDSSLHWLTLKIQANVEDDSNEILGVLLDTTEQRVKTDEQAKYARLQAQAGEQAVRMQRVSAALARSLTVTQVCDVLASEGSAALGAPRATVYLLNERRDAMDFATSHGPVTETWSASFASVDLDDDFPLNDVMRTGEPIVLSGFDAIEEQYPKLAPLARANETNSYAIVRLESPGNVYGVWSLAWTNERDFVDGELMVLLSLAVQGGQALERARQFERERLISTALQRTLLPAELPELAGASVARRYVPGSTDIEVGGDWYDVIPLSSTRVALVIGDVSGHNVDSAAVMGQVRNAVRSYAWEGHQAGRVLEETNRLLCGLMPGTLVTACFVELNLDDGIASIAVAGHPPPLVKRCNGNAEIIEFNADMPLGTDSAASYTQSTLFLNPGDTIVLYTDGIIEARGSSITAGLTYLCQVATAANTNDPDELTNYMLNALDINHREDDVALLGLRYEPLTGAASNTNKVVKRHLTSTPASAGVARRFANDVLSDWGVAELTDQVSLCVSELVTNALIHTATDVELVLRLSNDAVRVEILDRSDRMPVVRQHGESGDTAGRGLHIVEALADSWGIDTTIGGKSVWFQIAR